MTSIRSLPDSKLGTIYHINNGSAVQVNDQIAASALHTVRYVPNLYACCDTSTFTFQVRDSGNQTSAIATLSTFIVHVNQPPVATAPSPIFVDRGVSSSITISVFDPDTADVEFFTISQIGTGSFAAANGSAIVSVPYTLAPITMGASITASQTINFTAPANSAASSSLRFSVTAAGLVSSPFTVTFNVNLNQAPIARATGTIASSFIGVSSVFYLSGTEPDPADNPNTLQIVITSLPTKSILTVNGANATSVPITVPNNASCLIYGNQTSGNDQFTFRVLDVLGGLSVATSVNIRLVLVNRPPTASISTQEDVEVVGRVSANDPDNDVVTVYVASLPANGTLRQFDGTNITTVPTALTDSSFQFRFTGGLHEFGTPYTTFTLYADDGTGTSNSQSSTITATMNVVFVNYPPVAVSTGVSIPMESPATIVTVSVTDIETPASTTAVVVTLPAPSTGVLTDTNDNPINVGSSISSPWQVKFTPAASYEGSSSFQFRAFDGTQNSSNVATLSINVTHVNLPPSSQVYLGTAVRQMNFPITLVQSDPNIGDVLTITIVSYGGLGLFSYPNSNKRDLFPLVTPFKLPYTLTVPPSRSVSTTVNYLAPGAAFGLNYANISYFVTDQTGLNSSITTNGINIAANNPPTVTAMATINVTQDSTSNPPFTLSGTDIDIADFLNLSVILLSLPTKGTLFLNGTAVTTAPVVLSSTSIAQLTYTTNSRGIDQFSFTVQDLLLVRGIPITVYLSISNVNHPPVAQWLSTCVGNEDTTITVSQMGAYDQGPDNTGFTYYIASAPTAGTLTQADGSACASYPCLVTSSSNTMLFTPAKDGNGNPYATFSFYAVDSMGARSVANATGTIIVNAVNDPQLPIPALLLAMRTPISLSRSTSLMSTHLLVASPL